MYIESIIDTYLVSYGFEVFIFFLLTKSEVLGFGSGTLRKNRLYHVKCVKLTLCNLYHTNCMCTLYTHFGVYSSTTLILSCCR